MTAPGIDLKTIARNILSNYAGSAATVAITLISLPLLVRGLGIEQYGLWALTLSVLSYVGLFNFGIGSGVVRFVAAADGRGDRDELAAVCATGLVSATIIGGALTLALTTAALLLLPHLGVAPHLLETARLVLLINAATLLFGSAFGVFNDVLLGLQRFDLHNGVNVTAKLVEAAAMIAVVAAGHGVVAFALAALGVSLLVHLARYLILTRALQLTIDPRRFDRRLLGAIASFSSFLLVWRLGVQLIWFTDSIVISALLSVAAVGVYAVAAKFPELLRLLIGQVQTIFFPYFSRLFGAEADGGRREVLIGTAACLGIAAPAAATLILFAEPLTALWVGLDFSGSVVPAQLLMLSFMLSLVPSVLNSGLHARGRVRVPALLALLEGVLNLGLSLLLARAWGLTGVALGTVIASAVVNGGIVVPYACRTLGIPVLAFIRQAVLPPLLPLPAILLVLPLRTVVHPSTWPILVVELGLALAFYYGALWLTAPAELRAIVRRGAAAGLQRMRARMAPRGAVVG